MQPLPGADDPRYVHTNAVWSPDGKYLVFARAEAKDAYATGPKTAERANDPNETPIQYDLYRIPFNDGKGGQPEPVAGASTNGMSNSFPKISPDGRWIVFVQSAQRPTDAAGQQAVHRAGRRRRGPADALQYAADELLAQLFAERSVAGVFVEEPVAVHADVSDAHLDEAGNDSPAILIENCDRCQSRGEYPRVRQHPAGRAVEDRCAGDGLLSSHRYRLKI